MIDIKHFQKKYNIVYNNIYWKIIKIYKLMNMIEVNN